MFLASIASLFIYLIFRPYVKYSTSALKAAKNKNIEAKVGQNENVGHDRVRSDGLSMLYVCFCVSSCSWPR